MFSGTHAHPAQQHEGGGKKVGLYREPSANENELCTQGVSVTRITDKYVHPYALERAGGSISQ